MSLLENSDRVGRIFATTTSFADTGSTTLVAAPGAGNALAILRLYASPITTTAGFNDLSWRNNGTDTGLRMWTGSWALSAGSAIIDREFREPWVLDANVGLVAVLSLTTASTPTVYVNAIYRIVRL